MIERDLAIAEVARILRTHAPERAEEILAAIEAPQGPAPELLACLDAAKAGAKFKLEAFVHGPRKGRRRTGMELNFDSRDERPRDERQPRTIDDPGRITIESHRVARPPAVPPAPPRDDDGE